jgi:hypothetical protein
MNISNYMAKDYVIKQQLLIMEKQSQTNPIYLLQINRLTKIVDETNKSV